jgi:hypothetical protein
MKIINENIQFDSFFLSITTAYKHIFSTARDREEQDSHQEGEMDSNNSPSIMTAIVLGVPLTHHAPLLIDSTCMVESRAQHHRIFGHRRRGYHSHRHNHHGWGIPRPHSHT